MKHWTDSLTYTPCEDALEWLKTQPDAQTAWEKSERGEWMIYHAGKLAGEPGSDARRPLVLAACACARLSLPHVRKGELRPLAAIETAERWARGGAGAPTLGEVRRTADAAADAASYAANAASYAANAASDASNASNASYAASYAANAAYNARAKTLAECANIVRGFYQYVPS